MLGLGLLNTTHLPIEFSFARLTISNEISSKAIKIDTQQLHVSAQIFTYTFYLIGCLKS